MSASTLDQQTVSPPAANPTGATPPPAEQPRQRRRHLVLSATLALAALGVGGAAGGVLVTGTADPAPVAATASAPAAPAAPAPAPGSPSPASPAPASPDSDLPPGGATVVTAAGAPLPASTVAGVRTLYDALARGDLASVRTAYAPTASGAPWAAVEQVLADTRDRAGLLAAMRTPPQARGDVPYLYARDGYRLGLDDTGRLRFVRAP